MKKVFLAILSVLIMLSASMFINFAPIGSDPPNQAVVLLIFGALIMLVFCGPTRNNSTDVALSEDSQEEQHNTTPVLGAHHEGGDSDNNKPDGSIRPLTGDDEDISSDQSLAWDSHVENVSLAIIHAFTVSVIIPSIFIPYTPYASKIVLIGGSLCAMATAAFVCYIVAHYGSTDEALSENIQEERHNTTPVLGVHHEGGDGDGNKPDGSIQPLTGGEKAPDSGQE